jgi:membrane associated rhomboid family serine protease
VVSIGSMGAFGLLPVGVDVRVREMPRATIALAAGMVAAFGLVLLTREDPSLVYALAFKPAIPSVLTALTSLFVNLDATRLLLSLLFLAVFGPPLESRIGALRTLVAFLTSGWAANLVQAWLVRAKAPDLAAVPIAGSEGAISGLLALFLLRLYFARLVFVPPPGLRRGGVRVIRTGIPSALGVALWFAIPALVTIYLPDRAPALGPVAHVAGGFFGAILGLVLGMGPAGTLEARLAKGARHAEQGEWHAALREYESYLGSKPEDPEALAFAARLLRVTHQDIQAADRFCRAIRAWLRRGSLRAACDAYLEMRRLLGSEAALPPMEQLRVARGFEELGRPGEASRAYEAYGREYPERHAASLALLRSADIERRALDNPGRALYLYEELAKRDLTPDLAEMVRERKKVAERALERGYGKQPDSASSLFRLSESNR